MLGKTSSVDKITDFLQESRKKLRGTWKVSRNSDKRGQWEMKIICMYTMKPAISLSTYA